MAENATVAPGNAMAHDDADARVAEFKRLVDGISVVMVTTVSTDDLLRSRPMLLECVEADGALTFLTHLSLQRVALCIAAGRASSHRTTRSAAIGGGTE